MTDGRVIAVRTSKTVYRVDDRVMKVFDEEYSKADILNEALNQARVEETGLNIPKILEVTKVDGKWAIVSEYIEGKPLARLMDEEPAKKEAYLRLMVEQQLLVQAQKVPLLSKLKEKFHRKISGSDLSQTLRHDLLTRLDGMPRHEKLCHGDFNPSNIIIDPTGTPFVLDWSHATQGNASADAARSYLLFWLNGDIDGADRYLDLFCEMSRTEKKYVQKWLPIVAASQLTKSRPQERAFLMQWIDVMDFE